MSDTSEENLLAPYFEASSDKAAQPEPKIVEHATKLASDAKSVAEAKAGYEQVIPYLEEFPGHEELLIAAMNLLEKQRLKSSMLESWAALNARFPENTLALRMHLRWLRRMKRSKDGLEHIATVLPDRATNAKQAVTGLLAYTELRAFDQIDEMMLSVLRIYPDDSKLRILYARCLMQQNRFIDAGSIVEQIKDPERLSAAPQRVIAEALEQARFQRENAVGDPVGLPGRLASHFNTRMIEPLDAKRLGTAVFLTGQLGAGGAERQLTRIAGAMEQTRQRGEKIAGVEITEPVRVAVRHANPDSESDFFLPVLTAAGVETEIAINSPRPKPIELFPEDPDFSRLVEFLPDDVLDTTLRLVPYFRKHKPEVVYIWQDGAVLVATLAALVAEVPRVVISFRGLPPNLRPDLFRPELETLYKALTKVPGVVFSSNSLAAAREYATWMDYPLDRIPIVYNALDLPDPNGEPVDHENWDAICAASPECDRTVVGVFRYDHNKRPQLWIRMAAAYLEEHPNTRFIIVGGGNEFNKCKRLVSELGLENRIFLNGRSTCVGYWLEKADALLHCSRYEGLPNAVIEAQMSGVPVVATPAGGMHEAMVHGETGYCLASFEEPSIAETVKYLENVLTDEKQNARMGQNAAKFAAERFSVEHALEATMKLFKMT